MMKEDRTDSSSSMMKNSLTTITMMILIETLMLGMLLEISNNSTLQD